MPSATSRRPASRIVARSSAATSWRRSPSGGDLYIVSHCIHNWDEESCVRILANCRRAMAPGGRLLIVEAVVSAGDEPDPAKILDLAMLLVPGGEERSEDEYRVLLEKGRLPADARGPDASGAPA